MARLPKPGSDTDKWAELLNDYLLVSHNPDGTQRTDLASVSGGLVRLPDLDATNSTGAPLNNLVLSNDGTNLTWQKAGIAQRATEKTRISVTDFGAKGDGVTDDTDAVQAAINAATDGGAIEFVRGIYMIRTLKIGRNGISLAGSARLGTRLVRLSGTDPILDISGSGTGIGHVRYCSLSNLTINGNNLPGPLIRSYYADTCLYRDVSFVNCNGVATDLIEVWDSRFYNCSWENCGSTTDPAMLLRNSAPLGTFGYSTDNTNQIHFLGCRWEAFRNGALRLDGSANGSTTLLNGVFLVSCKMESSLLSGPPFQIMAGTTIVYVNQLYMALMAADTGYTTRLDAIVDYGTQIFMSNVYIQWGAATGLANSAVRIARGDMHIYQQISAYYPTEPPAVATIAVDSVAASNVTIASIVVNRGLKSIGDAISTLENDPTLGTSLAVKNSGFFRISSYVTGKDLYKADNSTTRPTLQTVNGADLAGFSGDYTGEKWRFYGDTGFVRLASGKFQIEGTKGYVGIGTAPYTGIAFLIKMAADTDRGLTIIRSSSTMTGRLLEFQDETNNIQGVTFDAFGRPLSVGRVANVAPGDQVSYANPRVQARDIAGSVTAAVVPNPTIGSIAIITFSKPFPNVPLSIVLSDHSVSPGVLYVSARSTTGFTVSTRRILQGGSIVDFDYLVMGQG